MNMFKKPSPHPVLEKKQYVQKFSSQMDASKVRLSSDYPKTPAEPQNGALEDKIPVQKQVPCWFFGVISWNSFPHSQNTKQTQIHHRFDKSHCHLPMSICVAPCSCWEFFLKATGKQPWHIRRSFSLGKKCHQQTLPTTTTDPFCRIPGRHCKITRKGRKGQVFVDQKF